MIEVFYVVIGNVSIICTYLISMPAIIFYNVFDSNQYYIFKSPDIFISRIELYLFTFSFTRGYFFQYIIFMLFHFVDYLNFHQK